MAFCINCGQELADDAKFCAGCGKAVNDNNSSAQRKSVYDGELHKCPNCGEVLNSFVTNCPSCDYEIRGISASSAVKEFAAQLTSAKTQQEKTAIIRNFPIPNTKEDIMEFMILASSNITNNLEPDISAAWQSKIEQAYQKATILFQNEQELLKIQNIYTQVCEKLNKQKKIETVKRAGDVIAELMPVLPNIIIVLGWLLSIFILLPMCRINLDDTGTNGYQLLLMFDLIAGSILIPFAFRCGSPLPKVITSLGLILSIIVLIPLCGKNLDSAGTNTYQLILILDIICSIIILIRMFKQKGNFQTSKTALNKISFIIALACVVILLIAYAIASIV